MATERLKMEDFFEKNNLVELQGEPFIIDMMYAKPENITMHPIYAEVGFGTRAYIHRDFAARLQTVADTLIALKLKMRICDAYRPPVAHRLILDVLPVKGLFASKAENSLHCYGTAIDCCLTDEQGNNLLYPTEIDAYEKKYAEQIAAGNVDDYYRHFAKAAADFYAPEYGDALRNRDFLRKIMCDAGFEGIRSEWWHFQLPDGKEKYPFVEWNKEK